MVYKYHDEWLFSEGEYLCTILPPLGVTTEQRFGESVALAGDNLFVTDRFGTLFQYIIDDSLPQNHAFVGTFDAGVGASTMWGRSIAAAPVIDTQAQKVIGMVVCGDTGFDEGGTDAGAADVRVFDLFSPADACVNARDVTPAFDEAHQYGVPMILAGCTTAATVDGSSSCSGAPAKDLWYVLTPTEEGDFVFDLSGSDYDTVVSIHDACPGDGSSEIACDDDSGPDTTSYLTVHLLAAETYRIRISGWWGHSGQYELAISRLPAPVCSADIAPSGGDGLVDFGDLLAILSGWGPCPGCDADVDDDASVGLSDLLQVLAAWGPCP